MDPPALPPTRQRSRTPSRGLHEGNLPAAPLVADAGMAEDKQAEVLPEETPQRTSTEELRKALRRLELPELMEHVIQAGVDADEINTDKDVDSDAAKEALIERIVNPNVEWWRSAEKLVDSTEFADLSSLSSLLVFGPTSTTDTHGYFALRNERVSAAFVAILTVLVLVFQGVCAWKLMTNAEDSDPDMLKAHMLEGWLRLDVAWMKNINHVVVPCGIQHDIATNLTLLTSTECRLAMADAFGAHFDTAKTVGETNLADLPVCFTTDGLTNGGTNLAAGMLIVGVIVAHELSDSIAAKHVFPIRSDAQREDIMCGRTPEWYHVAGIRAGLGLHFHLNWAILILLLYATIGRLVGVANEFWAVIEASVAVFLVVQVDDFVFAIVRSTGHVRARLKTLYIREHACQTPAYASAAGATNVVVGTASGEAGAVLRSYGEIFLPATEFATVWRHYPEGNAVFWVTVAGARACASLALRGCEEADSSVPSGFAFAFGTVTMLVTVTWVVSDIFVIITAAKTKSHAGLVLWSATGWIALLVYLWLTQPGEALDDRDWRAALLLGWWIGGIYLGPLAYVMNN